MRSQFDKQLAQLHRELIEMGALCEQVIALSSQALTNRDTALAEKVAPWTTRSTARSATSRTSACGSCFSSSRWLATCGRSPLP